MGHAEVFALHDVVARYWWQRGYEVLNPMGFDSFGLPAENAAIRHDEHPTTYTWANIAKSIESCRKYAASFDWSRTFNTSDPEYYRWTQWLFLEFFKRGLAYRKNSPVNWCPNDQTVLANEQVVGGVCERCGAEVTKKDLTQWYFKITDYAQELLDGLDELEDTWPDRVVTAQRNWIGRSEGAHVDVRRAQGRDEPTSRSTPPGPTRCTARRSWWWRPTPRWPRDRAPRQRAGAGGLPGRGPQGLRHRPAGDRPAQDRCLPGRHATNPVTGEEIPVWAPTTCWPTTAPARSWPCPRHDQRDLDFARGDRPAGAPHRRCPARRPGGERRRDVRRRGVRQLRRPGRAGRQGIGDPHDRRAAGGRRARHRGGQLPAARLAAVAGSATGAADPDHPLPGGRRGRRCPRTSCRWPCPS